jgi:nucleotide-binding universal stress UspA family protein
MKTILVPVDFSKPAENAARYALHLAKTIQANITLCHALYIPLEVPTESIGSWSGYDPATLREESMQALEDLAAKLRNKEAEYALPGAFKPEISCITEAGGAVDVVTRLGKKLKPSLIVMGMTGAGTLAKLFYGSISRSMIENTQQPLVLVPDGFLFSNIKKIAFAASLIDEDCEVIHALASFARFFHADLLAAHVSSSAESGQAHQLKVKSFLNDITCKIDYDRIYYRQVDKETVDQGLDWLSEHGMIDLLVMVHRQKGLFESIFLSHTHARAKDLRLPLMVLPEGVHPVF